MSKEELFKRVLNYFRKHNPAPETENWRSNFIRHDSLNLHFMSQKSDYRSIITIEPGKRGGKPCIRGMRITVYDILNWLASGMTVKQIIEDFPDLTEQDISAALQFAADRESRITYLK